MDTVTINITETPNDVTINVTVGGGGMQCADLAACQTIIDILADITAQQTALNLKIQSVTGSQVDNTDPNNPIVNEQQVMYSPDTNTYISVTNNNLAYILGGNGTNYSSLAASSLGVELNDNNLAGPKPLMLDANKRIKGLTAAIWGAFIVALTGKTTPIDADSINISDSASSGTAKKVTLTNFKAFLKTYFDTIYTTTSAVATQITTALSGYLTAATAASIYQKLREVISSNKTAVLDEFYTVNSTCTFTDPTPSEGKGYTVFVINGTVTVGGVAYSEAGTKIERVYYSGAWVNYVYGKLEKELLCSFNSTNLADVVDYRFGNTYLPATLSAGVSREFPFMLNGKIKEIVFTGLSAVATSSLDCVLKITNKTTGVTTTVGNIRFDNITLKVTFAGLNILGSKGDTCEVVFSTPAFPSNGSNSQGSALLFFEGI